MAESVDVVVIGMGPAGDALAGQLAESGLSVIGIEAKLVGGECPYWGCIPSKMMVRAANLLAGCGADPRGPAAGRHWPAHQPVLARCGHHRP